MQTKDKKKELAGDLYADVHIFVLPVSSLRCLPPPTSPTGKDHLPSWWLIKSSFSSLGRVTSTSLPEALLETPLQNWTLQWGSVGITVFLIEYQIWLEGGESPQEILTRVTISLQWTSYFCPKLNQNYLQVQSSKVSNGLIFCAVVACFRWSLLHLPHLE